MTTRPGTANQRWRRLALAALGAMWIGGCSVLQPIDVSPAERLFVPGGYSPDASDSACAGSESYAEGLGTEICRTDSLRLQWMGEAAQVSNNAVNFNALSWPLASAALYYNLKVSDSTLLLPATVAAGLYGFLNSGIPGRDAIDRKAAKALACDIIEASVGLYHKDEFKKLDWWLRRLQLAIRDVEKVQGALIDRLPTTKATCRGGDSIERLTGKSSQACVADPLPILERYLADRLAWARQVETDGHRLELEVTDSAARLRAQRAQVALERHTALAEKTPALRDPSETQKSVAAFIKGWQAATMLGAESGRKDKGSGAAAEKAASKADPKLPSVPSSLLRRLKPPSREDWRQFESGENSELQFAVEKVRTWTSGREWRQVRARQTGQTIGCDFSELPPATPGGSGNGRKSALPGDSDPPPGTPLLLQGGRP